MFEASLLFYFFFLNSRFVHVMVSVNFIIISSSLCVSVCVDLNIMKGYMFYRLFLCKRKLRYTFYPSTHFTSLWLTSITMLYYFSEITHSGHQIDNSFLLRANSSKRIWEIDFLLFCWMWMVNVYLTFFKLRLKLWLKVEGNC